MNDAVTRAEFNDRIDRLEGRIDERMTTFARTVAHDVVVEYSETLRTEWKRENAALLAKIEEHERFIAGRRKMETAVVQVAASALKSAGGLAGGKFLLAVASALGAGIVGVVLQIISLLGGGQ